MFQEQNLFETKMFRIFNIPTFKFSDIEKSGYQKVKKKFLPLKYSIQNWELAAYYLFWTFQYSESILKEITGRSKRRFSLNPIQHPLAKWYVSTHDEKTKPLWLHVNYGVWGFNHLENSSSFMAYTIRNNSKYDL